MTGIVDAHHHIWRHGDLPWLIGPMQPRIFGPYEPLRRDYPMHEYLADVEGAGVNQSVYVQTNWAMADFEREAEWVNRTRVETGWPHAIVAFADFTLDDVRPHLDRLARHPLVRGARMQLHWHENPQYRFAARPDLCDDPVIVRNIARLADYHWSFDLQVFADQMQSAARLARACSNITFVLQHAGMPEHISPDARARWRSGMKTLAAEPNVFVKLSGLGTFIHRNDPTYIGEIVTQTVELFGADRCLFGSNFPIEKLWTSYSALLAAYRKATKRLTPGEADDVFAGTARRVYRLS